MDTDVDLQHILLAQNFADANVSLAPPSHTDRTSTDGREVLYVFAQATHLMCHPGWACSVLRNGSG